MITNIYKSNTESDELCVDICEVLYNILNQIYSFTKVVEVKQIKDIKKISDTINSKQVVYVNVSEYKGSLRTVLRRLNLEAFVNINTTVTIVVPTSLLKFVSNNCMNISVEYVPKILTLVDTIIEIEEKLAIVTFNPKEVMNNEH